MEKNSKLYRQADWYRPLFVTLENGNEVELNNIIIYDEKGIVVQTRCGYFDNDKGIDIKGEIVKKIKENFTKKENYVLKGEEQYSNNTVYDLYVYRDNVNVQFLGFKKTADLIMAKYNINGGEFKILYTTISGNKYIYENRFKELKDEIKDYSLPMEEEELDMICKELIEVNKKIIEEKKRIEDFKIEGMEEEAQKIVNRLMGK